MEFKDYYDVMGVARGATQVEIKRAYRKLARKFHPDVSKASDAESRFKEVGEAYAVLKDPEKRAAYDQLGKDWKQGEDFRPPPDWSSNFEYRGAGSQNSNSPDFSDFFSSLFSERFGSEGQSGHSGQSSVVGEDHHAKVMIELEDAYQGATRNIVLRTPALDASGKIMHTQRTLKVKIPKGVTNGQRIRLSGQAAPQVGNGRAGDLYLEVQIATHDIYRVDEHDVILDVPITPWEAALGANIEVPTPAGLVNLKIPAGAIDGRRLRLKGRGIPGSPAGDLYVDTKLTLPSAESAAAKSLYKKMQNDLNYNPRKSLGV